MKDISILIPARSEEFLKNTVEDILAHKEADTEIIVGLDGVWSNPPLLQYPDVNVIYVPEAIGQRAMAQLCGKLSKAKYIMKVDAHCSFEQGFDRKMLEAFKVSGDNTVMVPVMKNLHVYDWKCYKCGKKVYQDVTPICPVDGSRMRKKIIWQPRRGTHSVAYRFDSEPHFQYWSDYTKRDEYKKMKEETGLTESMSLQGSFFMCTREKYYELNVDDGNLGSWGHQGLTVACKFWLSGGKVMVNHNTWYAHCFRTKGDVFGFPYPQPGREVQKTKQRVKDLFYKDSFPGQIYPLSWLIERFWPIPGWTDQDLKNLKAGEKKLEKTPDKSLIKVMPDKELLEDYLRSSSGPVRAIFNTSKGIFERVG